jgi:hypothetical protein
MHRSFAISQRSFSLAARRNSDADDIILFALLTPRSAPSAFCLFISGLRNGLPPFAQVPEDCVTSPQNHSIKLIAEATRNTRRDKNVHMLRLNHLISILLCLVPLVPTHGFGNRLSI